MPNKKIGFKSYVLIGFFLLIIFFIINNSFISVIQKNVVIIFKPFLQATNNLSYSPPASNLTGECQNIKQNNLALESKLSLLTTENNELRKLLDFKKTQPQKLATANVISKEINNAGQLVIIDQGETSGIRVGDPVVIQNGILIGKIITTQSGSSVVRLITDNQSKVAVTILGQNQTIGVLEGGFGISLTIKFIPRNESVTVGTIVVSSGQEERMPRGLLLGTISAVENEAYQPFQQAILTPAANLTKLQTVGVLTSP